MPTVDVFNLNHEVTGQLELSEAIFGVPVKTHVLHEVVVYQLAKRRAGTAKTKGRSEVRGGAKSPGNKKERDAHAQGPAVPRFGVAAGPFTAPIPETTKCTYPKR